METNGRMLSIATYNVHSCVGWDGRRDPDRIARVIEELDADVVALQEFSYPADIAIETREPRELTRLEGYECALGPTLTHRAQSYGNVLLSRLPIRELARLNLSQDRREPRGALAATIDLGGIDLHVVATHLGLRLGERRLQIGRLLEHIRSLQSTFVAVLGDFNDWHPRRSAAKEIERVLGAGTRLRSYPSLLPWLSLDRIWVAPAEAVHEMRVHSTPLARRASDHLPVRAVLRSPTQ